MIYYLKALLIFFISDICLILSSVLWCQKEGGNLIHAPSYFRLSPTPIVWTYFYCSFNLCMIAFHWCRHWSLGHLSLFSLFLFRLTSFFVFVFCVNSVSVFPVFNSINGLFSFVVMNFTHYTNFHEMLSCSSFQSFTYFSYFFHIYVYICFVFPSWSDTWKAYTFLQFIKVLYYQLKYGFQKEHTDTGGAEKGALRLLDESWLSADSFLHHLCKVVFQVD